MKKLVLFFCIILIVSALNVVAENCKSKDDLEQLQLEAMDASYYLKHQIKLVRMDAVIDTLTGEDTSKLVEIRNDFSVLPEKTDEAIDDIDKEDFMKAVDDGNDLLQDFRKEANKYIDSDNREDIMDALEEAMEDNEKTFDTLRDDMLAEQTLFRQSMYDAALCHLTELSDKYRITDVNSNIEKLSEELYDLKDKLEEARDNCEDEDLSECKEGIEANSAVTEFRDELNTLKSEMKTAYKEETESLKEGKISDVKKVQEKEIEELEEIIKDAKEDGIDVTGAEGYIEEAKQDLEDFPSEDSESSEITAKLNRVKENLVNARDDLIDSKNEYKEAEEERNENKAATKTISANTATATSGSPATVSVSASIS